MSEFENEELAEVFSGVVRLFPLPNMVMFPHVMQQLHLFEPRYVRMLEDAVKDDQLIAMALLASGWQDDYEGVPPIHDTICIGRVISHSQLPSQSYNVLLQGLTRARVIRELTDEHPYRRAEVTIMKDHFVPSDVAGAGEDVTTSRLRRYLQTVLATTGGMSEVAERANPNLSLGQLTDILAYSLDLPLEWKQRLLAESDVRMRSQSLVEFIDQVQGDENNPFPPDFSSN